MSQQVFLNYTTSDGQAGEIPFDGLRISFGRGSEADFRFADQGLSRLHASVNRDGDRFWVLDERSTNGTFVNGAPVPPQGTPLADGDVIKIGHETSIVIVFQRAAANVASVPAATDRPNNGGGQSTAKNAPDAANGFPLGLTIGLLVLALVLIGGSAAVVGLTMFGERRADDVADDIPFDAPTPDDNRNRNGRSSSATPTVSPSGATTGNSNSSNSSGEILPNGTTGGGSDSSPGQTAPNGRYQDMNEADRDRYIAVKAEKVARIIGNQKSDPIPPAAVQEIKRFLSGYVSRVGRARRDSCDQSGWLSSDFVSVLNRASKTSPFVIRSFRAEGIEPQIGIYVAMIEGEHCPCLTSSTGAKGMFQFLASSAPDYGLAADDRCNPEQSAKAGAKYLKTLIARFGTAPDSVPLAIASFNSGQGNLSKNLDKVFASTGGQNRSFWTLAANKNLMEGGAGKQFADENIKYVPKFFAAAIIGENPQDFGVTLQPLSTYTN